MVDDRVDRLAAAVDDVEHAGWQARLEGGCGDQVGRQRHLVARLEHKGVAAGDRQGPHPERNHRREVEGRNPRDHAKRLADRVAVDATGHVLERLSHQEARNPAGELDVFQAAADVAAGLGQGLAMLAGHALSELVEAVFEHHLEPEENPGPVDWGRLHPGREGRGGRLDGLVDRLGTGQRRLGDHLAAGGIVDRRGRSAGQGRPLAADQEQDRIERGHNNTISR